MNKLSLEWRLYTADTLPDLCWLEYVIDGASLAELLTKPAQQYYDNAYLNLTPKQLQIWNKGWNEPKPLSIELPLGNIGALGTLADQVVEQMQHGFTDPCHIDHLEMLLITRPSEVLHSGRTPFYICAACGDYNCGTISAYVKRAEDAVEWSEFRYEVNFGWKERGKWVWAEYDFAKEWADIGPFAFDYAQYEQCLRNPPSLPEEILRQLST